MRLIYISGPGEICLNYMWLPSWLGMSSQIKADIEKDLQQSLCGMPMDDAGLDKAHTLVLDYLEKKFPSIVGFRDYLDAVKFVSPPKAT